MHGNARSSPLGRLGMVLWVTEEGEPVAQVARRDGHVPAVRVQMGAPLPEESQAGLEDRSSRPRCSPTRTSPGVEEQLLQARRMLRAPMRKIAAPLPLTFVLSALSLFLAGRSA